MMDLGGRLVIVVSFLLSLGSTKHFFHSILNDNLVGLDESNVQLAAQVCLRLPRHTASLAQVPGSCQCLQTLEQVYAATVMDNI